MDSSTRLLDEATHKQVVSEMGKRSFADTATAIRHLAYSVRSGKRFSPDDVVTILSGVGLSTDEVPVALADLTRRRILDSYPKEGTVAYFMERGARVDYGDALSRTSRGSGGWNPVNATPATSSAPGIKSHRRDACCGRIGNETGRGDGEAMMSSRHLQITRHDDVSVIRFLHQKLVGDLPEQLGEELYGLAAQEDCTKILLNLSDVNFLASDMLGKVVGLNKRMKQKGGTLTLCEVCPSIRQVITITKVDAVLTVKGTEAEGLMALA